MHVLNLGMIACFVYAIPIRAKMSSLNAKSPSLSASAVLCSVMLGPSDSERMSEKNFLMLARQKNYHGFQFRLHSVQLHAGYVVHVMLHIMRNQGQI